VVKFWGSQKLYTDFPLHGGLVPLSLVLFKGQLYFYLDQPNRLESL